jgi:predicted RNA-binding Zn ribbon-like protein
MTVFTPKRNPQSAYAGVVLLEEFLNTYAVGEPDRLADEASAAAWLESVDRAGQVLAAELGLARDVRAALRAQLGDGAPTELPDVPVRVALTEAGPRLVGTGSPLIEVVAESLGEVLALQATGEWSRIKACARDSCRWVFFDHSRNRSGRWCSMQVCGNREKTAAYRARKR